MGNLAKRIDDAKPKLILSASHGIEPGRQVEYKPLLDGAIEMASHKPAFTLILQRDQGPCDLGPKDEDWFAAQEGVTPADCGPVVPEVYRI